MCVGNKDAVDLFYQALGHQIFYIFELAFPAAIEQEPVAVVRNNDATGGKLDDPIGGIEMQAVRHEINFCPFSQHTLTTNAHPFFFEVPV